MHLRLLVFQSQPNPNFVVFRMYGIVGRGQSLMQTKTIRFDRSVYSVCLMILRIMGKKTLNDVKVGIFYKQEVYI